MSTTKKPCNIRLVKNQPGNVFLKSRMGHKEPKVLAGVWAEGPISQNLKAGSVRGLTAASGRGWP